MPRRRLRRQVPSIAEVTLVFAADRPARLFSNEICVRADVVSRSQRKLCVFSFAEALLSCRFADRPAALRAMPSICVPPPGGARGGHAAEALRAPRTLAEREGWRGRRLDASRLSRGARGPLPTPRSERQSIGSRLSVLSASESVRTTSAGVGGSGTYNTCEAAFRSDRASVPGLAKTVVSTPVPAKWATISANTPSPDAMTT